LPADILGQEFRTSSNTLSFWKFEHLDDMTDALKALILSSNGIKTTQTIIVGEHILKSYGFEMKDTCGITGYLGRCSLHSDMVDLTYEKIGVVMQMLHNDIVNNDILTPRFDKKKYGNSLGMLLTIN